MAAIQQQKIRIRLKAFDRRILDASCEKIVDTANRTAATAIGPIPLPTKRRIYCLLRSPHVDKDSREHFETRTHRRIIDIHQPSAKTIDALMKLDLPAGVDIEVKLWCTPPLERRGILMQMLYHFRWHRNDFWLLTVDRANLRFELRF